MVDRPEDAVISDEMREVVRALAHRCTVCVVSGRDRAVVQELMGVDDLVVAGSHGFVSDIWSPEGGRIEREEGAGFADLLRRVTQMVREEVVAVNGALVEAKKSSVAVHYRLVVERDRPRITDLVDRVLASHPEELKMTPGKMVYEIQQVGRMQLTLQHQRGFGGCDAGTDDGERAGFRRRSSSGMCS